MVKVGPPLLTVSLLCVSCSNAAIDPSQSLVGAKELPSATALARETLFITRGGHDWGGDSLSYELRPDDSLIITHSYLDDGMPKAAVKGKEAIRISHAVATQVRKLMWRVRPSTLEGQGLDKDEVRPIGCERRGPHDFAEVGVAFIDEADPGTTKDDRVGVFELPRLDSCSSAASNQAREIVGHALRALPPSKVAAGFERTL